MNQNATYNVAISLKHTEVGQIVSIGMHRNFKFTWSYFGNSLNVVENIMHFSLVWFNSSKLNKMVQITSHFILLKSKMMLKLDFNKNV